MYKNNKKIKNILLLFTMMLVMFLGINTVSAETISTAECVYYFPKTILDSNIPSEKVVFDDTMYFTVNYNNGIPSVLMSQARYLNMRYDSYNYVTKSQMENSTGLACPKVFIVVENTYLHLDSANLANTGEHVGYAVKVYGTNVGEYLTACSKVSNFTARCAEVNPNMEKSKIYNAPTYVQNRSCTYVMGASPKTQFTLEVGAEKVNLTSALYYTGYNAQPLDLIKTNFAFLDPNIKPADIGDCNPINVCEGTYMNFTIVKDKPAACKIIYANDELSKNAEELEEYYSSEEFRVNFVNGIPSCSSIQELLDFLDEMYGLIIVFMVIALIIFGMLDFGQAAMSEKPEAMKTAAKKFRTRIIIVVIIVLLPALLNMTFSIFTGANEDKPEICIPGL
jgi:hypothetical protein